MVVITTKTNNAPYEEKLNTQLPYTGKFFTQLYILEIFLDSIREKWETSSNFRTVVFLVRYTYFPILSFITSFEIVQE